MHEIFADTFFFVALAHHADAFHQPARIALHEFDQMRKRIVTTDFILLEFGSLCSGNSVLRSRYLGLVESTASAPFLVVPASRKLLRQGIELFTARSDKQWSVLDCTSFVVMIE